MRRVLQVLIGGAVASVSVIPAFAQNAATGTGSASVTIVQPIAITATGAGLQFGRLVKPTSAGTVTIAASNGAQSLTGGAVTVGSQATSAAKFNVTGDGSEIFTIGGLSSFSMTGSGAPIVVTPVLSATTGTLSGASGSTGSATFTVGGTMALNNAQAVGAYNGNFTVTVTYQ